jgi:sugar/nucleoside kinase (ribokinase family)
MTVLSTIHQLKGKYPVPNMYQEIQNTFVMPGGEAANCAIVLKNLGLSVRLDGSFFGEKTEGPLIQYFRGHDIDCSNMQKEAGFEGWQDIVLCDGESRTVFGWYVQNLFNGKRLWTLPSEESIRECKCVDLNPFFGAESELVAKLCIKHNRDYITIDCKSDNMIAQNARVVICSQEFLDRDYPGIEYIKLLEQYKAECKGLVIFTFGSQDILYLTKELDHYETFTPFRVPVADTLGAGDTFRAGVVYGILKAYAPKEIIRFAAAGAGVVCTRFPSVQNPPKLEEIRELISKI